MVRGGWCGDGRLVFIGRKMKVCMWVVQWKFPLPRGKSFLDLLQQQGTKRCNGRDLQLTILHPFPGSFLDLFSCIRHSPRQRQPQHGKGEMGVKEQ